MRNQILHKWLSRGESKSQYFAHLFSHKVYKWLFPTQQKILDVNLK